MKKAGMLMLAAASLLAVPVVANAEYTLADRNSSAAVSVDTQSGMYNWTVDGVDHLYQQWFWYRVGNNGPEASIDTLPLVGAHLSDTNPFVDPGLDTLSTRYGSASTFWVDVSYALTGATAGSGNSDIAETITITNNSGRELDFHFFQYTDFDLDGTSDGDLAWHPNDNAIRQKDKSFTEVATTRPSHWQIGQHPTILNSLNDGSATTLSDSGIGSGDATFALEWDATIGAGGSLQISKDKNIQGPVPEPSTMLLLGSGLSGLFTLGSFKKRKLNLKKVNA